MRKNDELKSVSTISYNVECSSEAQIEEILGVEALATVIMNLRVTVLQIMGHWLQHLNEVMFCLNQRNWI